LYEFEPFLETRQNEGAVDCELALVQLVDGIMNETVMLLYSEFVPFGVLDGKSAQQLVRHFVHQFHHLPVNVAFRQLGDLLQDLEATFSDRLYESSDRFFLVVGL